MRRVGKGYRETLYNAIRGVDDKKLESDKARKSVSCEINYGIRFENNEQAETFIHQMAVEVTKRLNDVNMLGRSITLKLMKRDPHAPVEPPKVSFASLLVQMFTNSFVSFSGMALATSSTNKGLLRTRPVVRPMMRKSSAITLGEC